MRFIWWNMQRLGRDTDANRRFGLAALLGQDTPEVSLLCELTTQCIDPPPLNYTYRAVTNGQLCYAVVGGTVAPNPSNIFIPGPATACYKQARFKGGNNFTRLTNRAPGLTQIDGTPVYFFHAPASSSRAKKAVSYLACFLNETHGAAPWILVGDLNIEPGELEKAPVGINLADLIKEPDGPTFRGAGLAGQKEFDYALSNIDDLQVRVLHGGFYSDHEPILVTTGDDDGDAPMPDAGSGSDDASMSDDGSDSDDERGVKRRRSSDASDGDSRGGKRQRASGAQT